MCDGYFGNKWKIEGTTPPVVWPFQDGSQVEVTPELGTPDGVTIVVTPLGQGPEFYRGTCDPLTQVITAPVSSGGLQYVLHMSLSGTDPAQLDGTWYRDGILTTGTWTGNEGGGQEDERPARAEHVAA